MTSSATRTKPRKRNGRKKKSSRPRRVWLGLGSNLGDRRAHLLAALWEIQREAAVRRVSSLYLSEPVGYPDQPAFLNAAAEILWNRSPQDLLRVLQHIEKSVGRTPSFPNGPREIDIDILDFGGLVRHEPDPVLPHPRLALRRFALAPLAEIAPRWRHPILKKTASELQARLPAKPGVRRLGAGS
jgi:2-amino-4-hydroxy-6-hydroxymethyldihydropteridine diphosphokinase